MCRVTPEMKQILETLPPGYQRKINDFLEDNPREFIYSKFDLVNAFLTWEGIMGYTDTIITLVKGVYNNDPH